MENLKEGRPPARKLDQDSMQADYTAHDKDDEPDPEGFRDWEERMEITGMRESQERGDEGA